MENKNESAVCLKTKKFSVTCLTCDVVFVVDEAFILSNHICQEKKKLFENGWERPTYLSGSGGIRR